MHIRKTCKSAFYNSFYIRRIRKSFNLDIAHTLVKAQIISRLDYCKSSVRPFCISIAHSQVAVEYCR